MRNRLALLAIWPLVALGFAFAAIRALTTIVTAPRKAWNLAASADESANVALNG